MKNLFSHQALTQAFLGLTLLMGGCLNAAAQTIEIKPTYDFSLSREEKIKLAESAAPPEVYGKSTVYVLDSIGYVKVRDGSNGFTCFVDRQALVNLEPTCFDAEGSATTFLTRLFVEEQRAKGKNEDQIKKDLDEGYKSGKFLAPRKPGIVYMLSPLGHLLIPSAGKVVSLPPHLMFYAPYAKDEDIGNPPSTKNMPRILRAGQPDAYMIVMAPSDGATH